MWEGMDSVAKSVCLRSVEVRAVYKVATSLALSFFALCVSPGNRVAREIALMLIRITCTQILLRLYLMNFGLLRHIEWGY